MTRRILVTGSRGWLHFALVANALLDAWHDALQDGADGIVVVHGGAPGADTIAAHWAADHARHGVTQERHRADWTGPCPDTCPPGHRKQRRDGTDYCPFAGHRRNQHMVDLGADLALAFHLNNSTGTADCIRRASAAGIPLRTCLM